jgi:aldehyde dehydrogenase (NAD+)
MTSCIDPDSRPLPVGHFIGDRRLPAEGVIDMHRPSYGKAHAGCPLADEALVDRDRGY